MELALDELYLKRRESIGVVWDVSTEEGWKRAGDAIEAHGRSYIRIEVLDLDTVCIWFLPGGALRLSP
jgi:hypothetical protein